MFTFTSRKTQNNKTMMTKITVNRTIEVEINVEFPFYVKNSISVLRFDNKREGICITNSKMKEITDGIEYGYWPESFLLWERATKEEFEFAFKEVQEKINNLYNN